MRFHDLFSAKFVRGGRDVTTGLDCQGLMLEVMNRYGYKVQDKDTASYATEIVASAISDEIANEKWKKIEAPEEGCVVLIALDSMSPDKAQHLGVYIGEGKFIHIMEKRGVSVSRIHDRFFQQKIRGYYRWQN